MSDHPVPDDTSPLIRLIVVGSVMSICVIVLALSSLQWSGGSGRAGSGSGGISAMAAELTAAAAPAGPGTVVVVAAPRWIWSSAAGEPGDVSEPGEPGDAPGPRGPDAAATSSDGGVRVRFARTVAVPPDAGEPHLQLACDDQAVVRIDGREIGRIEHWSEPLSAALADVLAADATSFTIEVEARNDAGPAGLLGVVWFAGEDGARHRVVTDASWRIIEEGGQAVDRAAVEIAGYGEQPWGELSGVGRPPLDRGLQVPPGFVVEVVHEVPASQGSWVSLAVDARGRLLASDQSGGLFRITPGPPGADPAASVVEAIDLPVGAAQGLLCVGDDLYCVTAGGRADGPGLYRVRDLDADGAYDDWTRLVALNEGGEHGPHGIALGPDGRLHLVAGNYTRMPEGAGSLVPAVWDEDQLLPRMWDARGHAVGLLAPGGWICRMNLDGTGIETVATGFRNSYDIAFDRHGELFTYDSDMEWDLGTPWYRPTRIIHVVSGADYGWRSGSGKWPSAYPDTLPGTLDIGPGSPTGLCFGYETNFPPRFRDALFALDWTFGTVYAVHLEPDGASYAATHEPFLTGRPLPLADAVANPHDGALYLVLGGRGIRSAILRVRYAGPETAIAAAAESSPVPAQRERKALEARHGTASGDADLEELFTALGSPDRFIAHAARVALEHQPVSVWFERLRAERGVDARLLGLVAAARHGDPALQPEVVAMLEAIDFRRLTTPQRIAWLRAAGLCFMRLAPPDAEQARRLREVLEPRFPAEDPLLTRELCAMLVSLQSPVVVSRTIALMERSDTDTPPAEWFDRSLLSRNDSYGSVILKAAAAMPQQQQIALAASLRVATAGWTPELRGRYFDWFAAAKRTSGGLSFDGFLERIRRDALEAIPEEQRGAWESRPAIAGADAATGEVAFAQGPGRPWTVAELAAIVPDRMTGRDFENGRRMFEAAMCIRCHRVAGVGGDSGPDLTAVGTRFGTRDLLEAIIEPSRVISSQYEMTEFLLSGGTLVSGRVVDQDDASLFVQPSALVPDHLVPVPRDAIAERRISPVSPMMPRLLNALNEQEVLDLLAFLLAEGDARNPMFAPAP